MAKTSSSTTTAPVQAGDFNGTRPEWGRANDVTRTFGFKRGSLYNLLAAGHVKGCLIRIKGQKSGVRLFSMDSVREFIREQFETQNPPAPKNNSQ